VIDQTERRVLRGEKVPATEKIVSIFEPHTDRAGPEKLDRKICFLSEALPGSYQAAWC
jgi:hypothetical protein